MVIVYLRPTSSIVIIVEAQQDHRFWIGKSTTCSFVKVEIQILRLSNHFTTDDFAHLKFIYRLRDISGKASTWRI